jgi:hypothetical protein
MSTAVRSLVRTVSFAVVSLAVLSGCFNSSGRTCSRPDGSACTAYTGIAWTDNQVRDMCARDGSTFATGSCATSPYGTCVLLEGAVSEARVYTYGGGATEAIVEAACCAAAGSNGTWVSASGARRPCPTAGGLDEGI